MARNRTYGKSHLIHSLSVLAMIKRNFRSFRSPWFWRVSCSYSSTAAAGEPSQRVSGGKRSPLATSVSGPSTTRSPTTVS